MCYFLLDTFGSYFAPNETKQSLLIHEKMHQTISRKINPIGLFFSTEKMRLFVLEV